MSELADISVVMPVHRGVESSHLARALASVEEQTLPARQVVVVEDGPLLAEQYDVIDAFNPTRSEVTRVRLPVNRGAGIANQAGLEAATCRWIAKVDSDDVNLPHRFRSQYDALTATGADLCGAGMLEFVESEGNIRAIRRAPLSHRDIARRMRVNNPISHPTVMFRRSTAVAVGGYPDWRYVQDYGLFARMLAGGATMMNLDEPLVLFRSGDDLTSRRRSSAVRRGEVELQRSLRDLGLIGTPRMWFNVSWRLAFRMMPSPLVAVANRRILAKPILPGGA